MTTEENQNPESAAEPEQQHIIIPVEDEGVFYSPSTRGFYVREIHGENIPVDSVNISREQHANLLNQQGEGKHLQPGEGGYPEAVDRPKPSLEQLESDARNERERLLNMSNWTSLRDTADSVYEMWKPYRQALRDLPTKPGWPDSIEWPTPPKGKE